MAKSDTDLVRDALAGNQAAISAIYERYGQAMYRYCFYQLGDSEQAADLAQDVFIAMIHSLKTFSFNGSFKNWLYTIAKRQVNKQLREKYNLPKASLEDWLPGADDSDWLDPDRSQEIRDRQVKKLLSLLSPTEALILTLTQLRGYSSKEAAAVTGKTPESIRVIVHRTIKKLAKLATHL